VILKRDRSEVTRKPRKKTFLPEKSGAIPYMQFIRHFAMGIFGCLGLFYCLKGKNELDAKHT
jgi:hypothetical protein